MVSATLQQQIEVLEKRLEERVKLRQEYRLLKSVPGIGQTLATTIMLETGTVARFATVGGFQLVLPVRGQPAGEQRQEEGRRQHQERQQVPCLGVYRSGQLRYSLLPAGAAFL